MHRSPDSRDGSDAATCTAPEALGAQLDAHPSLRSILTAAAMVGSRCRIEALQKLTQRSLPDLAEPLAIALDARWLVDTGDHFVFRSESMRQALLHRLPPSVRRALEAEVQSLDAALLMTGPVCSSRPAERALAAYAAGHLDEVLTEARRELSASATSGRRAADATLLACIALVHLHRGALDEAEAAIAAAATAADSHQAPSAHLAWARALVLDARRDHQQGLAVIEQAVAAAGPDGRTAMLAVVGADLARLAVANREPEVARQTADELAAIDAHLDRRLPHVALRARAWATGSADDACAAVSEIDATAFPLEFARASEDAGRILLHAKQRSKAKKYLEQARAGYDEFSASFDAQRIDRLVANPKAERRRAGWDSLTPSEKRVAALVAEGLSNPEVAEELVVSRRTVETHLYRTFTKLGVSSRVELALLAAPHTQTHTPPQNDDRAAASASRT